MLSSTQLESCCWIETAVHSPDCGYLRSVHFSQQWYKPECVLLSSPQGSGGLRAAAAQAKKPEGRGGNTEDEGVSQDGKPQGAALPPLCTAAHGPVQSVILSAGGGRGERFTLISGI